MYIIFTLLVSCPEISLTYNVEYNIIQTKLKCDVTTGIDILIQNSQFKYEAHNTDIAIPLMYPTTQFKPSQYLTLVQVNGFAQSANFTILSDQTQICFNSRILYSRKNNYMVIFIMDTCQLTDQIIDVQLERSGIILDFTKHNDSVYQISDLNSLEILLDEVKFDQTTELNIKFYLSKYYSIQTTQIFIEENLKLSQILDDTYQINYFTHDIITFTEDTIIIKAAINSNFNVIPVKYTLTLINKNFQFIYTQVDNIIKNQYLFKCENCLSKVFFGSKTLIVDSALLIIQEGDNLIYYQLQQLLYGIKSINATIYKSTFTVYISTQNNIINCLDLDDSKLYIGSKSYVIDAQNYSNETFKVSFILSIDMLKQIKNNKYKDLFFSFMQILFPIVKIEIVSISRVYCYIPIVILSLVTAILIIFK